MYCMFRVVVALNQEHSRADRRRDSTATPAHQTYKHNRDRRRKPFNILRINESALERSNITITVLLDEREQFLPTIPLCYDGNHSIYTLRFTHVCERCFFIVVVLWLNLALALFIYFFFSNGSLFCTAWSSSEISTQPNRFFKQLFFFHKKKRFF